MMEMIKKVFSVLSVMPAFTNLFKKAAQTGKVDPIETLSALSAISPSTQKCADVAMNTIHRGGDISDVTQALTNIGEIEVIGQKLNTRTLIQDLKKSGGICSALANVLEKMPNENPQDIVNFGTAAGNISNWDDLIKNNNIKL